MEKKEFMALLEQGTKATKGSTGTADWERITAEAADSGRSYTISQFHKDVVRGAVSRGRVRGKLNDLFEHKQVARLVIDGAYHYCFDKEAIKKQHGE